MVKIVLLVTVTLLLGFGYFIGEPKLKGRVAQMSCDTFLLSKPWTLEGLRGRVALMRAGGDKTLLADNCATYPGKPMGLYFGWHKYLGQ